MEFALVVIPLLTIVLGVLGYGFMLSFRQSVSQAAAEGARAAAVAPASADRQAVAFAAIKSAMGKTCNVEFLQCTAVTPSTCDSCLAVTVTYNYTADPSKPVFLGLGLVMPEQLTYTATAEIS